MSECCATESARPLSQIESVLRTTLGRSEGGSAPTESRPLDRLDLGLEGSGPMAIMPAANTNRPHPPESRLDGCPSCVVNVEPPRSVTTMDIGCRCAYLCSDCGHAWTTDWSAE